jgi:two-component system sensor histidine kinase DegS
VKDDGQGFDPKEALNRKGLGLRGMEERMKLLGGELSVDSSPSRGTIIRARVPLDA